MTEKRALALLRKKDAAGLNYFMDHYASYVGAVARNILGGRCPEQDAEEAYINMSEADDA